jgi:hypothetical protein
MTGAEFEIRIDGTLRTYRDRKDYAMAAHQSKNPHSMVEVLDLVETLPRWVVSQLDCGTEITAPRF